jgi:hypothetical protein
MGVEKMSVSFDLALGGEIRASAIRSGQSVSAWLAESARGRLRLEALGEAVAAWEQEHGPLTEEEVADAELVLQGAKPKRRAGRR